MSFPWYFFVISTFVLCISKYALDFYKKYRHVSKFRTSKYSKYIVGISYRLLGTPTEKFQEIVRLMFELGPNGSFWLWGQPFVLIGKPEDLETTMQSQYCLEKNYLYKFTTDVVGRGLFSAPVEKWKRTRKLLMPTFNSKILENFLPIFKATGSIFVNEVLPKYVGKKNVDWYPIVTSLNLDSISQTAMGINTDAQRKELPFGNWLETCLRGIYVRFFNILYYYDVPFRFTKIGKEMAIATTKLYDFTDQVIREKKRKFKENGYRSSSVDENGKRKVFLDLLLDLDHQGMKFDDIDLRDEVNTFFVGGTDTSAVTTCFFLTMMGMHQDIQEEVYREIIDVLGPEEKIATMEEINNLKLIERCLRETFRLFPPAPFIARDVSGDVKISNDLTIPKGVSIFYTIFYTHRSDLYWDDPLKFNPDRFLPEEVAKRHPYTFIPFSSGLRGCVGQRYSYINLRNLMSMILRRYKVFCDIKNVADIELKSFIVLRPIEGFKFYLEERNK